jgi:hypothetical protein
MGECSKQDHTYRTNLRSAFEINLRRTSLIAFMNPFDIQMHVSWYHAIDTKNVHILVQIERRLSISVLRNKSVFTEKKV